MQELRNLVATPGGVIATSLCVLLAIASVAVPVWIGANAEGIAHELGMAAKDAAQLPIMAGAALAICTLLALACTWRQRNPGVANTTNVALEIADGEIRYWFHPDNDRFLTSRINVIIPISGVRKARQDLVTGETHIEGDVYWYHYDDVEMENLRPISEMRRRDSYTLGGYFEPDLYRAIRDEMRGR